VYGTCTACGSQLPKVQVCADCRIAQYCSRACQRNDWEKGHKDVCKSMAFNLYTSPIDVDGVELFPVNENGIDGNGLAANITGAGNGLATANGILVATGDGNSTGHGNAGIVGNFTGIANGRTDGAVSGNSEPDGSQSRYADDGGAPLTGSTVAPGIGGIFGDDPLSSSQQP
jgi:MYND finger